MKTEIKECEHIWHLVAVENGKVIKKCLRCGRVVEDE